jgi:hypothetical protein
MDRHHRKILAEVHRLRWERLSINADEGEATVIIDAEKT